MPYIVQERRAIIDAGAVPDNCGELNYAITMTCLRHGHGGMIPLRDKIMFLISAFIATPGFNYQRINDVLGACDGAARELDRRCRRGSAETQLLIRECAKRFYDAAAAPYEDGKIQANGDLPYE